MNIKPKFVSFILIFTIVFSMYSFTACKGNGDTSTGDNIFEGGENLENDSENGDNSNDDTAVENNEPWLEDDKSLDPMTDHTDDNYRTFYQIFVGSFSDSNVDGIGDIRGIINRFDYLNDGDINSGKDLGIQGIWLSPIFTSPTYHKYDAIDYYEIDPRFGSEDDLKELIKICDERNVKLILDLVINHSSDRNDWFVEFQNARRNGDVDNKYYDYYTCATTEERVIGRTYQTISGTNLWYECNFSGQMPELNFDNPVVREEMLNIAKYYLDLGIDGFRFDAVKYIYFGDTKSSVAFWEWYMGELTEYKPDIYCVGECWSSDAEVLEYYGAMNCFNFTTSQTTGIVAKAAKGSGLGAFLDYVENYQDQIQQVNPNGMPITFLSNHDMDRIAGTFTNEESKHMAANLYLLSPGSPFIYYGEEIGIKGSRGSAYTDANRRLAMLWGDGDTIQNPEGSTYKDKYQIITTVSSQLNDKNSTLKRYVDLISIRCKYSAIARGDYNSVKTENKKVGGFYIEYQDEILGLFHNVSSEEITIDIFACDGIDGYSFSQLCEVIGSNAKLEGNMLTIGAYTSVILR